MLDNYASVIIVFTDIYPATSEYIDNDSMGSERLNGDSLPFSGMDKGIDSNLLFLIKSEQPKHELKRRNTKT